MSDPKQLRFQFVVDEATLQKTRQLIRELTTDLQKLNEAAGKAGGGAAGVGGQGGGPGVNVTGGGQRSPEQQRVIAKTAPVGRQLVQGFLDQKQIFKGIADGSKDSLKAMSDALKQAIDYQKRELRDLDQAAKSLTETYGELGDKLKSWKGAPGMSSAISGHRDQIGAKLVENEAERQRESKRLDELHDMHRQAQQKIDGGGDGGVGGGGGGPGMFGARGMNPKFMAALKIAGMVVAGADSALDETIAGSRGMNAFGARRSDIVSGRMAGLMGGDVKLMYAMKNMDSEERKDLAAQTSGFAAEANQVRGGITQTIGNMPVIGGIARMLGIGGGKGGAGGILGGFTTAEQQSGMAEDAMAQAEAKSRTLVMENFAMDRFRGQLGQRISTGRTLGLGRNKDPKTGKWVDSFDKLELSLQGRGYSTGEYESAKLRLQGMGGERFAHQYADAGMRANAQGLGDYIPLLTAAQRAGIGGDFARGSIGGGIDQTAGIQLGQSIIGNGFDARGTTTGMGTLMAAQGGFGFTGNASDFNTVQRAGLGLQLGDSLTTGGLDPYQKGRNLVSAVNANPGMSIYGQDYLANGMSMKQMIDMGTGNSPLTATAEALGLNQGMIKKQLTGSVTSVLDRFRDDPNKNDPMSQTIRQFRKFQGESGGDLGGFYDSLQGDAKTKAMRNIGSFFGIQTGLGEEAGLGTQGFLGGLSNAEIGTLKKGDVGRKIGQTEQDQVKGMAEAAKKVSDTLQTMGDKFNNTLKDIPADFEKMRKFNDNLVGSADVFIKSLQEMTTAIKQSTAQMQGFKIGAR